MTDLEKYIGYLTNSMEGTRQKRILGSDSIAVTKYNNSLQATYKADKSRREYAKGFLTYLRGL